MSDGFQSAYPPGVAIVSGAASSQEADVAQAGEAPESGLAHARTRGVGPDLPLRRWRDVRAELPALRAQLRRAERKRDVERERLVAAALARALVKRRAELDIAVRLARRAVLLGDDSLRVELAGWHCQLGQTALAVGMLVPLLESPGLDRARLAMRIALYWARLGQAEQALAALREAAAYDPEDPLVHELQATVYGWAPRFTSAAQAADAYLRGAERRAARNEEAAAFQDLLRAFDTSAEHREAAALLVRTLGARGQGGLSDEVWRRHADALIANGQLDRGCTVHLDRLRSALAAGAYEEAFASALDARLDAGVDARVLLSVLEQPGVYPPIGEGRVAPDAKEALLDTLLFKLGLWELLAARLELAAEAAKGALRSRAWLALGNLLESPIGNTERALEPWMLAVVADPESEPARTALRRHATSTGDYTPLVEALIRVGLDTKPGAARGITSCLGELARLAAERLDDPALELWCVKRALEFEPESVALWGARKRLGEPAALATQLLEESEQSLEGEDGDERVSLLRQVAAALRGRPDRAERYVAVLRELSVRRPQELRWRRLLENLLARSRDAEGLSRLWTRDLVAAADPNVMLRALLGLSRLERQAGNLQGSLAVLAADDGRGSAPAASLQMSLGAQLGNRRLRAEGLLKLGALAGPTRRAWLASVAAADLIALGELPAALAAAEVGTHADPNLTRPIVAYADAAEGRQDRVAAVAFERAMALTFPSSAHCRGLVSALEALGEHHAAQVWTGRWLSLRPAETAAATQLLRGSARVGDAARLGDVVGWAVSQAHPLEGWAEPLANALTCLAESDPARASEVAWRVLDAFGPTPPALKHAVLLVAEQSGDAELQIAVIERELGAEPAGAEQAGLWRLAELHLERGEADRAGAVLVRALAAGSDPKQVLALLDSVQEPLSPEGEFHLLQARAAACEQGGDESEAAVLVLRQYGAALWDLARDQTQAIEVWLRAAALGGTQGWFNFAQDLVEVLGLERALDEVCRLAENLDAPEQGAALLTGAAVVSESRGSRRRALQLGLLALDTDPTSVWALEVVENCARSTDSASVESAYRAALGASLGFFGERALHYRAARFFERAGEPSMALTHAIAAFRAVPSEGGTFALMLRLAQTSKETERASRAIEEVAASHTDGEARSQWLRRAALIAGGSAEGAQQRMEVLLRALFASPDTEVIDLLERAFTDLARQQPDGRSLGLLRFSRAVTKLLPKLESIDGARVAIAMARVALDSFSDPMLALTALTGAISLDPEADEFVELVSEAPRLAAEADAANAWLDGVLQHTDAGKRGSLGLLELAHEVALGTGRLGLCAGFLVRRLDRASEPPDGLAARAEQLVRRSREEVLPPHVVERFPEAAQQSQLLARAEARAAEADRDGELGALEEAFQHAELPPERILRLLELARETDNLGLAERALAAARKSDLDAETVKRATLEIGERLIEQRRPQRALKLLEDAANESADDVALLELALSAARASGDEDRRQELLERLIALGPDAAQRSTWYNEAWEVAKKRGHPDRAGEILRRWLDADPEDTQALSRLEAQCEEREDWAGLAELIGRHLSLGVSFRERRRLVLWRSELLEVRLDRLAEARQELSALVEQAPADRTVVERLAQVAESLGDRGAAANAWLTASGLSSTRPMAAQLAERACRLYLDTGEVMSARRVLAAPQTLPRTIGLARLSVRLERDGENEPRLARALEELAAVEEQSIEERAQSLLEAANLWRRLGDEERACQCAVQAALLVPDDAEAQILASYLEYRRRGPSTRPEARASLERLERVFASLADDQRDLGAFLLAESLDVVMGGDAGLARLLELRERFGALPLISVGLAERISRGNSPRDALPHFDAALSGGDLRALRKPSRVALEAAQTAKQAGLLGLVHRYAKLADIDPDLGLATARLREDLVRVASSRPPPVRPISEAALPPISSRPSAAVPAPPELEDPAAASNEELEPQTRPVRRTQIGIGRMQPRHRATQPGGGLTAAPRAIPMPAQTREPSGFHRAVIARPTRADGLPVKHEYVPKSDAEMSLWGELGGAPARSARELCQRLIRDPARSLDLLAVCLAWLRAEPSERALEWLERAAEIAGDAQHAAAVAHARRAVSPVRQPQVVPPLEYQVERGDVLRGLLFNEPDGTWPRAFDVIWESTRRVLEWEAVRDIKAAQRIGANDTTEMARAYGAIARRLALETTPLWHLAQPGERRVGVVMLGEASVLVRGEPTEDGAELRYDLGAALAGTLPAFAIVNAATYEQIEELFRAVHCAFGPPSTSQTNFTSTARLAALLWESMPPRTQRLMTDGCRDGKLTRESAIASARRAARRGGLFAAGDLSLALGRVVAEESLDPALGRGADGLTRLCERSAAAADLVRLACDPLYAYLRWRPDGVRPNIGVTRRGL